MSRLSLHLFGPPRIEIDGRPVSTDRRKAVALLAYLAVTRQNHTREALAALLWPDYDQSRAYAYLRRTLWEINQVVGKGWITADRDTVGLEPNASASAGSGQVVWVDVTQFQILLAESRKFDRSSAAQLPLLREAVELYRPASVAALSAPVKSTVTISEHIDRIFPATGRWSGCF